MDQETSAYKSAKIYSFSFHKEDCIKWMDSLSTKKPLYLRLSGQELWKVAKYWAMAPLLCFVFNYTPKVFTDADTRLAFSFTNILECPFKESREPIPWHSTIHKLFYVLDPMPVFTGESIGSIHKTADIAVSTRQHTIQNGVGQWANS